MQRASTVLYTTVNSHVHSCVARRCDTQHLSQSLSAFSALFVSSEVKNDNCNNVRVSTEWWLCQCAMSCQEPPPWQFIASGDTSFVTTTVFSEVFASISHEASSLENCGVKGRSSYFAGIDDIVLDLLCDSHLRWLLPPDTPCIMPNLRRRVNLPWLHAYGNTFPCLQGGRESKPRSSNRSCRLTVLQVMTSDEMECDAGSIAQSDNGALTWSGMHHIRSRAAISERRRPFSFFISVKLCGEAFRWERAPLSVSRIFSRHRCAVGRYAMPLQINSR